MGSAKKTDANHRSAKGSSDWFSRTFVGGSIVEAKQLRIVLVDRKTTTKTCRLVR